MEKVAWLIVGDNNFWYTTTQPIFREEFDKEIKNLKEDISKGTYRDEPCKPNQLFAYPLHVKMEKVSIDLIENLNSN